MGDSFVDVTYRGLEVGRRLRIRDFTADGAYVEVPAPMPVGSSIEIAIEGGVVVKATVARVHEQTGGNERPPGMGVHAAVDAAARAWWEKMRAESPAPLEAVPHPVGEGDGGKTEVMAAIDPDALDPGGVIVDDGKKTIVMPVVDIEAIAAAARRPSTDGGEDSGEIEVTNGNGDDEDVSQDGPSGSNGTGAKKRKRRRTRAKK